MTRTMVQEVEVPIRIVRLPAVQARTGARRSTIYVRLAEGSFPRPVQLGSQRRGLDRGGGGRVDSEADRVEPRRSRVSDAFMETKEQTMQPFMRTVRAAAWTTLTLWLLFPRVLWAQGTSPWVEAVNELQAQFTGPIARGLSLIAMWWAG